MNNNESNGLKPIVQSTSFKEKLAMFNKPKKQEEHKKDIVKKKGKKVSENLKKLQQSMEIKKDAIHNNNPAVKDSPTPFRKEDPLIIPKEEIPKEEPISANNDIVKEDNKETSKNDNNINPTVKEDNKETSKNDNNINPTVKEDNKETNKNDNNSTPIVKEVPKIESTRIAKQENKNVIKIAAKPVIKTIPKAVVKVTPKIKENTIPIKKDEQDDSKVAKSEIKDNSNNPNSSHNEDNVNNSKIENKENPNPEIIDNNTIQSPNPKKIEHVKQLKPTITVIKNNSKPVVKEENKNEIKEVVPKPIVKEEEIVPKPNVKEEVKNTVIEDSTKKVNEFPNIKEAHNIKVDNKEKEATPKNEMRISLVTSSFKERLKMFERKPIEMNKPKTEFSDKPKIGFVNRNSVDTIKNKLFNKDNVDTKDIEGVKKLDSKCEDKSNTVNEQHQNADINSNKVIDDSKNKNNINNDKKPEENVKEEFVNKNENSNLFNKNKESKIIPKENIKVQIEQNQKTNPKIDDEKKEDSDKTKINTPKKKEIINNNNILQKEETKSTSKNQDNQLNAKENPKEFKKEETEKIIHPNEKKDEKTKQEKKEEITKIIPPKENETEKRKPENRVKELAKMLQSREKEAEKRKQENKVKKEELAKIIKPKEKETEKRKQKIKEEYPQNTPVEEIQQNNNNLNNQENIEQTMNNEQQYYNQEDDINKNEEQQYYNQEEDNYKNEEQQYYNQEDEFNKNEEQENNQETQQEDDYDPLSCLKSNEQKSDHFRSKSSMRMAMLPGAQVNEKNIQDEEDEEEGPKESSLVENANNENENDYYYKEGPYNMHREIYHSKVFNKSKYLDISDDEIYVDPEDNTRKELYDFCDIYQDEVKETPQIKNEEEDKAHEFDNESQKSNQEDNHSSNQQSDNDNNNNDNDNNNNNDNNKEEEEQEKSDKGEEENNEVKNEEIQNEENDTNIQLTNLPNSSKKEQDDINEEHEIEVEEAKNKEPSIHNKEEEEAKEPQENEDNANEKEEEEVCLNPSCDSNKFIGISEKSRMGYLYNSSTNKIVQIVVDVKNEFFEGNSYINIPPYLYVSGGIDPKNNKPSRTFIRIQLLPNNKDDSLDSIMLPGMINNKAFHTTVYNKANNTIIAIGGRKNTMCEMFYIELNRWKMLPSLHESRENAIAVIVNDKDLYVFLGYDRSANTYCTSIEKLNIIDNEENMHRRIWEILKPFGNDKIYKRQNMGFTFKENGELLIFGGIDINNNLSNQVVKYNFKQNEFFLCENLALPSQMSFNQSQFCIFNTEENNKKIHYNMDNNFGILRYTEKNSENKEEFYYTEFISLS